MVKVMFPILFRCLLIVWLTKVLEDQSLGQIGSVGRFAHFVIF